MGCVAGYNSPWWRLQYDVWEEVNKTQLRAAITLAGIVLARRKEGARRAEPPTDAGMDVDVSEDAARSAPTSRDAITKDSLVYPLQCHPATWDPCLRAAGCACGTAPAGPEGS
jgi:hypothetical protein